ncbi:hypothetical protein [Methylobacterium sp. J-092]|uniref:hypothetical protein n=1 Tax=Methylobacterium sp. J-092 TaxID=2836667 RepID=UPI001FBADE4A|nr:hypothetical protein [Methylobacterium sp. J-092]MCJ2006757.1 hypothetical protein [Methylobacterium sp. J-092]
MTTDDMVTDETLMALADGELDPETAKRVRARLNECPELASRLAAYAEVRALLAPVPADTGIAPPDRLKAAILRADAAGRRRFSVVDGGEAVVAPAPPANRRRRVRAALPLAASLALLVGGAAGWTLGRRAAPDTNVAGLTSMPAAGPTVSEALTSLPSGRSASFSDPANSARGTVTMVASYTVEGGGLCRTYDLTLEDSRRSRETRVSCRRDGAWRTELVLARPGGRSGGFATASGGDEIVDQFLSQAGGSDSLSAEDERRVLKLRAER